PCTVHHSHHPRPFPRGPELPPSRPLPPEPYHARLEAPEPLTTALPCASRAVPSRPEPHQGRPMRVPCRPEPHLGRPVLSHAVPSLSKAVPCASHAVPSFTKAVPCCPMPSRA